jgi:hypothetical protein
MALLGVIEGARNTRYSTRLVAVKGRLECAAAQDHVHRVFVGFYYHSDRVDLSALS